MKGTYFLQYDIGAQDCIPIHDMCRNDRVRSTITSRPGGPKDAVDISTKLIERAPVRSMRRTSHSGPLFRLQYGGSANQMLSLKGNIQHTGKGDRKILISF